MASVTHLRSLFLLCLPSTFTLFFDNELDHIRITKGSSNVVCIQISKLQNLIQINSIYKAHWLKTYPTNKSHFINLKLLISMSHRVMQLKSTYNTLYKISVPLLSKLSQR